MSEIAPDHVLAKLVEIANNTTLELAVTLTVKGSTITGTLISNRKWYDLQAQTFKAALKVEGDEIGLHSLFENWRKIAEEQKEEEAQVQEALEGVDLPDHYLNAINKADGQVAFIHLTDARIVHPDGSMPGEGGTAWRGRLEEISGWFVGELKRSSS